MSPSSIRSACDMWPQYQTRFRDVIANMSPKFLSIRPSPDRLPIWATAAHVANVRVYWICDVIGEPGAEDTPFGGRDGDGWEDHLDPRRGASQTLGIEGLPQIDLWGPRRRQRPDRPGGRRPRRLGTHVRTTR